MDEDEKPETEDERPETEDEPTAGEPETEDETGTSGEFDDLRDRLERIESMLGTITETLESMRATASAIDIDNGADVVDVDGDGDADVIADDEIVIPDYEDMDLDL